MDNVYLATYSFGMESGLSMEGMLQKAAEIGYAGVEFSGDFISTPAPEMKRLLEKYCLEAVSAHVMMSGVKETIPYMAEIGGKMVIVPGHAFATREEAIDCAALLNENGREAARHGIKVGYHNHTSEFFMYEGKPLLDYVIESSDPEYVGFQLDCGWASAAGINPAEYIKKHAGRIMAVHVKENNTVIGAEKPRSAKEPMFMPPMEFDGNGKPVIPPEMKKKMEEHGRMNVAAGTGIIDWRAVRAAAEAQGCRTFIVEREWSYNDPQDRVKCLAEDFVYLRDNI